MIVRYLIVAGAIPALLLASAACGGDDGATAPTAAATPATQATPRQESPSASASASAAATGATAAATPAASPGAASPSAAASGTAAAARVSANNATRAQLQAAFEAAGIPGAAQWAREVEEYRPYANDPNFPKLRQELAKYNPAAGVVDKIVAVLSLP